MSAAPSTGDRPNPLMLRYAAWVDARPKLAALILVLVSMPALALTVLFFSDVRAGLTELLPPNAPAVEALTTLHERLGGVGRFMVVTEGDDPEVNRRFIAELGDRLEQRHLPEVKFLQKDCKVETEWAKNRALLLMPQAEFEKAMSAAEDGVKKAKRKANPLLVDLEEDDDSPEKQQQEFAKLDKELDETVKKNDRYPHGMFEDPSGRHVLLMMSLQGSDTELEPSERLFKAVKEEVAAIRSKYPPELKVGYPGEVPNLVEEHDAILADLSLSSLLVFLLVGGVIFLYFRSLRGLITVLFALTPGLLFTFAIGKLSVGHLNSNTAFLGSIIAGNGINYPLLYLAYFRGRRHDEPRALAVAMASRQAFFGTLAAALAASAAYGALSVSTFRGFSQFGWLGGVGMVTTWLFTFVAMPVAIALFDPPRVVRQSSAQRYLLSFFSGVRAPRAIAVAFVLLALGGAALGVVRAAQSGLYETNLRVLRNRYSLEKGAASWDHKVALVFGIWLNPVAGIVKDPEQREPLATSLTEAMIHGPGHLAERVQTIETFVPPLEEQDARLERIRKLVPALKAVPAQKVPEKARPYVERWVKPENLKPITVDEVPWALRSTFTEVDGRTDRTVLVFPSLQINYDDSRNVLQFDHQLNEVPRPSGAVIGGGFVFMAEIIELVQHEAPRIVWVVALVVAFVLAPMLRKHPARIAVVVATVGAVAVVAQANMVALGVRINMLSFAAMPITIGVGADYVVNLIGAMDALKLDARRACARMGGAIFLCSATTIIGYASLLVAESGALRTFGWAAVLGEIMAVTTVLLVLPAAMAPAVDERGSDSDASSLTTPASS
jgi:predicted RND superfamily exporter protein